MLATTMLLATWLGLLQGQTPSVTPPADAIETHPEDAATCRRVLELMYSPTVAWHAPPVVEPPKTPPPLPAKSAGPVLIETAQAEDPLTRLRGIEGLAETHSLEHIDALVAALSDPIPEIRDVAARALGQLDAGLVFEKIMPLLSTGDSEIMPRMDSVLPMLRDALEPRLIAVLASEQESSARRQIAARTLGRTNSVGAVETLARCAESSDADLSLACTHALAAIRDPVVLTRLRRLAGHPEVSVRYAALQGIAGLGGPESMAALQQVALSPPIEDPELQRQAVVLLGDTKSDTAIPLLIEIMRRDLNLLRTAVEALRRVTGEDLGDRPALWDEWLQQKRAAERPVNRVPPDAAGPPPWEVEYMPE